VTCQTHEMVNGSGTLHIVRAMSAAVDQLRRRQISNSARQMRGAFWLTYIMSAVSEKLSARARDTYACASIASACLRHGHLDGADL